MQFPIGEDSMVFLRIIRLPDNGGFVPHHPEMPVQAVLRDVQLASLEPLYIVIFKIPFQQFIPALAPVKMTGNIRPESFRIIHTFFIRLLVLFVTRDLVRIMHMAIKNSKVKKIGLLPPSPFIFSLILENAR